MCTKVVECSAKIRNPYMSQLPSIITFALHFGDINKGENDIGHLNKGDRSDNVEVVFNSRGQDVLFLVTSG
jgi:hypothetical protein